MAYHGLFMGIDRYASGSAPWLTSAERDATALHALFEDTLGTGGRTLLGTRATRANLLAELDRLALTNQDDVVLLAFSGHGSTTHELVTYDADLTDLRATAFPLDDLVDWFSRIPAHRLVCILDCCFSGGAGAKVLVSPLLPRGAAAGADVLDQLAGNGRLIITASMSNQEAHESVRHRHGLLTHHMLEALTGAPEVLQAGKVSLLKTVEHVMKQVSAAAALYGREQQPTMRGQLDGDLLWPVFKPGAAWAAAFPEHHPSPATGDVASLAAHGFTDAQLAAWKGSITSLNELQIAAINDYGVLRGDNLLVTAPTSSGKTMVGELAALKAVVDGRRAVFLMPMRALVNDKYAEFRRTYPDLRTIRVTGEFSDDADALRRGQFDICLLTYELFASMAVANPHVLAQLGVVVVDEIQTMVDPTRGPRLEFLLSFLRFRRRRGDEPQVVALSAGIGDTGGLESWLGGGLLRRDTRPVPLREGLVGRDGSSRALEPDGTETQAHFVDPRWGPGSDQDLIIPVVKRLVEEGKQVIVFREMRGKCRGCAMYLAQHLGLEPAESSLRRLPTGDDAVSSGTLRTALAGGVGFHTADLTRDERQVMEEEFRAPHSSLRVLVATTTLAMGINTPAEAVVVAGLEHPRGLMAPESYSVAEYKNIVGRAGRLGFASAGESYIIAMTPANVERYWQRYVKGTPEDITSRFLDSDTDPRTLIIQTMTALTPKGAAGMDAADIVAFLEDSFGAYQQRAKSGGWRWDRPQLDRALAWLQANGMVRDAGTGMFSVTVLGHVAGESGIEVESVGRLAAAFRSVAAGQLNAGVLIAAVQLTLELDSLFVPMHAKSRKELESFNLLRRQQVAEPILDHLSHSDGWRSMVMRGKRAAACLYWINGVPVQEIEALMTQHVREKDAAGDVRAVASRTRDLIGPAIRIAGIVHRGADLATFDEELPLRLEIGLPRDVVPIARVAGGFMSRAEYLALRATDFYTIKAIADGEVDRLIEATGMDASRARRLQTLAREAPSEKPPITLPEIPVE